MGWFNKNKELKQRIAQLENQIKLMQEHIAVQKEENLSLNKKIRELEMLLDIEQNTKRY
jgi:regulator of replication initiation timing